MWIIFGVISVVFCLVAWFKKSIYASCCSLAFVSLTFLAEYKLVLDWVNKSDWSALMDVVPTMFKVLTTYIIIMLLVNALIIGLKRK